MVWSLKLNRFKILVIKSHDIESKAFSKSTKIDRPLEFSYSDSLKMSKVNLLFSPINLF